MGNAEVKEVKLSIPTYGTGKPQKAPMFFEKRVYQGSSGKVYPNAVIEKIYDDKKMVAYDAVVIENDFIEVVVLPELGGRIYYAVDKTNGYDFVYRNKVIKPALVGLLGPWISGGIEFNWPQHHRPTTYMPVNYRTENHKDGSACVYVGEIERMFGLRQTTCIKLYKDKSYIEISTEIYNGEESARTFLWWANPAYKVNDDTVTIMPPDVNAVMDHGKRDVSTFPIATGTYYKMDYTKGVDISKYKNIPVPTSFMAYKSEFDFIGGYDYGRKAGLLHVADHLVSPGKKQWTWGCGDFGKAWDRNLTDDDGPYVELMTGCFTDNQPDFTFIEPHESKKFTQYFMPYHDVGRISNADENLCFGCENGILTLYSSIYTEVAAEYTAGDGRFKRVKVKVSPCESVDLGSVDTDKPVRMIYDGRELVFDPAAVKKFDVPSPATACPEPEECSTCEELYICGRHIEQYRHATRIAQDYYEEGLKRDPSDIRLNNAMGECLYNRGLVEESVKYFGNAVKKATLKNGNPEYAECFYNLAKALLYLGNYDEAYENFGKCLWGDKTAQGLYFLAVTEKLKGRISNALKYIKRCVEINPGDTLARNFYARLIRDTDTIAADKVYSDVLRDNPLDAEAAYGIGDYEALSRVSAEEIRTVAGYYFTTKDFDTARGLLEQWKSIAPCKDLLADWYYLYAKLNCGEEIYDALSAISEKDYDRISFAVSLTDKHVLETLIKIRPDRLLLCHLGNLEYDKRNYDKAAALWREAVRIDPSYSTANRNLALYEFNKRRDKEKALGYMEKAYASDCKNSRFLLELSQLYAICKKDLRSRLALLESNLEAVSERDDLYAEYLELLADNGKFEKAMSLMEKRRFHPWEGGEGKITRLYKRLKCALGDIMAEKGEYHEAEKLYKDCLVFPHNLGEGKLILDYDNDVWYKLGDLYDKIGDRREAERAYKLALRGDTKVADNVYYNDIPVDYIYFAAKARLRLGDTEGAVKIAVAFSEYVRRNKGKHVKIDYFAVSLPDLLIWEQDLDLRNDEFCNRLSVLADDILKETE